MEGIQCSMIGFYRLPNTGCFGCDCPKPISGHQLVPLLYSHMATGKNHRKGQRPEPNAKGRSERTGRPIRFRKRGEKKPSATPEEVGIRLNKYIANAGICSRREADKLIESGVVSINGKVVEQLGTKVMPGDKVQYGGATLRSEKMVYILLNKPKDYITTVTDPQGRKTVLHLVHGACKERIYPVGRLDRATSGLLLLTNDGDITRKLTHPKHGARKIYHLTLHKNATKGDLKKLVDGVELEDGMVHVHQAEFVEHPDSKRQIGIEIHSGKNRVIRRMMEELGYKVVKLDRVSFAGLSKKKLSRGRWRFLEEREIGLLKMIR